MKVSLPYIQQYRDRHGKLRRYFRKPGIAKVRLRGEPGSPEFIADYNAALSGHKIERAPIGASRSVPGSLSATIAAYYQDTAFLALAPGTRKMRRQILERFRAKAGELPIRLMRREDIAKQLGKLKPFAARNWLKAIRGLMQFAVDMGLCAADPTTGIKPVRVRAGTIHTWTEDEIEIFERRHEIGTKARLAMALMLFTAARRGDVVRLGPQHLRQDRISYRQEKTGRALSIPVHPVLAAVIAEAESGHLTFLVTPQGTPYTPAGLGHAIRRWCDEAGLPQCSAHGLRKAQARRLAEAGCSAHEIASITGHKTLAEVQRYADAADQSRLADAAISRTSTVSPLKQGRQSSRKSLKSQGTK
jgi:integrase